MRHTLTLLAAAAGLAFGGFVAAASAQQPAPAAPEAAPAPAEPAAPAAPAPTMGEWLHGSTLVGELKYPPDFPHWDYVNPDAPKGGVIRMGDFRSFDSLNIIPDVGDVAPGAGAIYDTLMAGNLDESSSEYGLLAEALRYPDDYSSVTYRLRQNARWHDGEPITVEDVIWSFETLVANSQFYADYYSHVVSTEKTGDWEVTFSFDETGNRELPQIVGQLPILPQHYWEGTDAAGNRRDVTAVTLEPPLGSGPYRIASVDPGRSVVLDRVPDYWGADLNVNIGQDNFDQIRYEIYLDETVLFEAFKADEVDFRAEYITRRWVNEYSFPAVAAGQVKLETIPMQRPFGEQLGYIFNLRRDKFQDVRVRRALTLAFPFETVNRDLFFGAYFRPDSFFDGIEELEANGLPEGRELDYLNGVRDLEGVPPEVFTADYSNPINGTDEELRANLQLAVQLLTEAGWELRGNSMVNVATGEPFTIEYLNGQPTLETVALRYQEELAKIGIDFQIRTVDSAQYVNRLRAYEYDVIYTSLRQSESPGNEQYGFWGSESANDPGSRNYAGISNPAVDKLIDDIVFSTNRDDLTAATRALDRVLSWNYYVMPGWTYRSDRIAYWDRFSHPDPLPPYSVGFPTVWWYDTAKAAAIGPAPL